MSVQIGYEKLEKNESGVFKILEDGRISVDKLLDVVDMKLDWYIPSDDAIEFIVFLRLVLGEEPENSNPKTHYFMIDCLFQSDCVKPYFDERNINFDELKGRTCILCTREFSKSVLITFLILFMASKGRMPGFGRVNYGVYVSDSMRNGVKNTMNTLEKVYLESKYLRSMFEAARFTDSEMNLVRKPKTKKEIDVYKQHVEIEGNKQDTCPGRMKRTFSIKGVGAETGTRGTREALDRPQFAFFDDLVAGEKDAESKTILDNIESTIEADVLKGLSGNGHFEIIIGTPYNKNDPVYRRIEEGTWLPVVFPRAREIYEGIRKEDFVSVWEDRHSYENQMKDFRHAVRAKENGNGLSMRKLMQEYYLRISNDNDRMISDQMIQWFKRIDIEKRLDQYNLYMTTDFTTTGSAGSDMSGIAVWAVGCNGDFFMLDLCLRKQELDRQYDEVFRMNSYWSGKSYKGMTVGIEVDGGQRAHINALKDRMINRAEYFTIGRQKGSNVGSEGIMSRLEGGNKHWRFRMMLPHFQNRKLWFPEELRDTADMRELLEELTYCTYTGFNSKHDDGADLISQLGMMDIIFPMKNYNGDSEEVERIPVSEGGDGRIFGLRKVNEENGNIYSSYA